jgi:RimJ/RimL family protein N-acetyltransferase
MVKKCGFVKEGLLKKSFLKNWKLYDQEIYGITKMHVLSKGG